MRKRIFGSLVDPKRSEGGPVHLTQALLSLDAFFHLSPGVQSSLFVILNQRRRFAAILSLAEIMNYEPSAASCSTLVSFEKESRLKWDTMMLSIMRCREEEKARKEPLLSLDFFFHLPPHQTLHPQLK
jgi:hypothetical protein